MRDLLPISIEVITAIVARRSHRRVSKREHLLHVCSERVIAVKRGLNAHTPLSALGIYATASHLATNIDQIIFDPPLLESLGSHIDHVALGYGVKIYPYARIALEQAPILDLQLIDTHKFEQRIDIDLRLSILRSKAIRLNQRCYGNVVNTTTLLADTTRKREAVLDMLIDNIGLVIVQAAQQRLLLENRHRALGQRVDMHHQIIHLG